MKQATLFTTKEEHLLSRQQHVVLGTSMRQTRLLVTIFEREPVELMSVGKAFVGNVFLQCPVQNTTRKT